MFDSIVVFDLGKVNVIDDNIAQHDDGRTIANLDRHTAMFDKVFLCRFLARTIAKPEITASVVAGDLIYHIRQAVKA
jgi:hypothetical protein